MVWATQWFASHGWGAWPVACIGSATVLVQVIGRSFGLEAVGVRRGLSERHQPSVVYSWSAIRCRWRGALCASSDSREGKARRLVVPTSRASESSPRLGQPGLLVLVCLVALG